jgi:hypothetical protein
VLNWLNKQISLSQGTPMPSIQQEFSRFCLTLSNTGTDRIYDKLAITKATLGLLAEWEEFEVTDTKEQELDEAGDVLFWLEILKVRLVLFSGTALTQESELTADQALAALPDAVEKYVRPVGLRSPEKRDADYLLIGQALVSLERSLLYFGGKNADDKKALKHKLMQHLMTKLSARHSSLIIS